MRNSTKALIALMEQEDGVTKFQYAQITEGEWFDCSAPTAPDWKLPHIFRVKPKPIEMWAWKYPSSGTIGRDFYNKKQPDDTGLTGRFMILMREVTE